MLKTIISYTYHTINCYRKDLKCFISILLPLVIITFINEFSSFYIKKLDSFSLNLITLGLNIIVLVLTIMLIKLLYKLTLDQTFSIKKDIFRAFLKNFTALFSIFLKIIPIIIVYMLILYFSNNWNWTSTIISKKYFFTFVFFLMSLPIYSIYCFHLIIASIQNIGGFENTKLSFSFIKNNKPTSIYLIIYYFFPIFVRHIFNLFIMKNIYKCFIASIIHSIGIIPFIVLSYFYIINLKNTTNND